MTGINVADESSEVTMAGSDGKAWIAWLTELLGGARNLAGRNDEKALVGKGVVAVLRT